MNAPDTPFPFDAALATAADKVESKVVAWRRDFHQNPELGNREVRTAGVVAAHLRALGFDERFIRKWHYYLCYCEAAFALRHISVVHTLHSRANNLSL